MDKPLSRWRALLFSLRLFEQKCAVHDVLAVAAVTFAAFDLALRTPSPIGGKRSTHIVLRLGEFPALSTHISFVVFVRFYLCARHVSGARTEPEE